MTHDIVVIIVQVISVGLTYYFGRRSALSNFKMEALKKRYETAYVPYVKALYSYLMIEDVGYELSVQCRQVFLDILTHNLENWDTETLRLYPAFHKAFLDMIDFDEENFDFKDDAPEIFHDAFHAISLSILEHTQSIARELYLPPLGEALCENYRRNDQKPPEQQA